MTRGTFISIILEIQGADKFLCYSGNAFFGDNHSFNETLFDQVNMHVLEL